MPIFPDHITDIHCHLAPPQPTRIICVDPSAGSVLSYPGQLYSAGIHPWRVGEASERDFEALIELAGRPDVVAIGEIGFDSLNTAAPMSLQRQWAERQARLAQEVQKPVIWHIVRRFDELLALHDRLRPSVPWIVHGFRGNAELARQLSRAGILLSLGPRHNPGAEPYATFSESDAQPSDA